MRTFYTVLVLLVAAAAEMFAQSASNYTASRTTGITFTPLTSGSTFTWRSGAGANDGRSVLTSIGFDFWYMGTRYTQFNASTNGFIDLDVFSASSGASGSYDGDNEKFFSQALTIAPLYDNLSVSVFNQITYKLSGSFPNRVLTIEWLNVDYSGDSSPDLSFQVKLYEGTGVVEFVYGTMTAGSAIYSYTAGIHDNTASNPPSVHQALVQQTANTSTFSNTAVFNLSTLPTSNTKIELTPPVAVSPTNFTFTSVKWNKMTLNWTDNASNELAYAIYRSSDGGTTFNFVDSVDTGVMTFTNYGLSINTSYQWRVCAVTEGGLNFSVAASQGTNSGLLTGTVTVGPTGTYTTLTAAIAAIRTDGVIGATVFELQSTYTSSGETFPINLYDSTWASASKTITVRPSSGATGLSITSSSATGTLRFNKANYFTVDGRPGGTGSAMELTIENTSTSGFSVEFKNMAGNNTLQYITLKGVNTSTSGGVVIFTGSSVDDNGISNTKGNYSNTITYCDIRDGASTPANCIVGGGLTNYPDSNITISNNNIYNFFTTSTNFSYGISLSGNSTVWNITGNSFYQTASRTATGALTIAGIIVNGTSLTSITISGNYFGGSSASAGGGAFTVGPTSQSVSFTGIYLSSEGLVCTVQNNIIKNFALSTGSTNGLNGVFSGIAVAKIDTAYITGNTIGSNTGTGSISVNSGNNNGIKLIYCSSSSATSASSYTITNNSIGSVDVTNTTTSLRTFVYGISVESTGELATISGNTIGSSGTANSINYATGSNIVLTSIRGISCNHYGGVRILNNTIANLSNNSVSTHQESQTMGIYIYNTVNRVTISGNTIRVLKAAVLNVDASDTYASVVGICNLSSYGGSTDSVTISNNTIDSLISTASSVASRVAGISCASNSTGSYANNVVERNKITNLLLSTSSTSAAVTGISILDGSAVYKNNMISIGSGLSTSYAVTGIYDNTTNSNSVFYNTVLIGGTGVASTATNTYAYRRAAIGTDSVINNIFINNRSNSSTGGKHYSYYHGVTTSALVSNYNNFSVGGTGGVFAFSASSDRTTLALWKSANSGRDVNSVNTSVTFSSSTDLHLSGGSIGDLNLTGTTLGTITNDYDNNTRHATIPYMGADENTGSPLPVELTSFTAQFKNGGVELFWKTATEVNNYGFEIERRAVDGLLLQGGAHLVWGKIGFVEGNGTANSPKEYSYRDKIKSAGKYLYRLKQIDRDGQFEYSQEVEAVISSLPLKFELAQNYPNPFNPTTNIGFSIQIPGLTTLKVYDVIGREVETLVNEVRASGSYSETFDASKLTSGIYFAQLTSNGKSQVRKLMLMK